MIEIESNKEIKNIKQEYLFGFGLKEILLGFFSIVFSAVLYLFLPFTGVIKGNICMIVVIFMMFMFNFKVFGMTLFGHMLCLIKSLSYINRPLVYKDDSIKERRRIVKHD